MSSEGPKPRPIFSPTRMTDFQQLLDHLEQRLIEKQGSVDVQRKDTHQAINQTFQKLCQQLFELRRFSRNDIEQQALNAQIELQRMLDGIHCMRSKSLFYPHSSSEALRSFSTELERYSHRLSTLVLSPARDLDNLLSYLTASFTTIAPDLQPETPTETPADRPVRVTDNDRSSLEMTVDESAKTTEEIRSPDTSSKHGNDLNHFKFGSSILLAFPCDLVASNGRSILSYAIEKNFLNYSTITGRNLSSNKVYRLLAPIAGSNARLWDLTWCPWSHFYVIVGNLGLYSLCYPYDTNPTTTDHTPQVTKLISFRHLTFQHVRLAPHSVGWYIYMIEHQSVSIDLYDRRSGQHLRHFDNHIHHDIIPLGFHGFCLNENLFAIVKKTEVLSTINNPHQIENEQTIQIYFYDLHSMTCRQQMSLSHCSNVNDIKCCSEKNIFMILAEPVQLILVNLDTNELVRKKLLDDGKQLCIINDSEVLILRSECSIQTLQYRPPSK